MLQIAGIIVGIIIGISLILYSFETFMDYLDQKERKEFNEIHKRLFDTKYKK